MLYLFHNQKKQNDMRILALTIGLLFSTTLLSQELFRSNTTLMGNVNPSGDCSFTDYEEEDVVISMDNGVISIVGEETILINVTNSTTSEMSDKYYGTSEEVGHCVITVVRDGDGVMFVGFDFKKSFYTYNFIQS